MSSDPRGHRRYRQARAAAIRRAQERHLAGQPVLCVLCGHPLNPFAPYLAPGTQRRNPAAPTIEHRHKLSDGGHVLNFGPDDLAHRSCNDRQGQATATARKNRPTIHTRNW